MHYFAASRKWRDSNEEEHKRLVMEWETSSGSLFNERTVEYKVAEKVYQKEVAEYEKALDIETLVEEEIERWRKGKLRRNQRMSTSESLRSSSDIKNQENAGDIEDAEDTEDD